MEPKGFYTISEVASILSVNYMTVRRLVESGKIKALNIGEGTQRNTYRISAAELNNFIQSNVNTRTTKN